MTIMTGVLDLAIERILAADLEESNLFSIEYDVEKRIANHSCHNLTPGSPLSIITT